MRKFVLFIIVFGMVLSAYSQKRAKTDMVKLDVKRSLEDPEFLRETPLNFELNYDKSTNDVNRIPVGTAKSQRSFRREDTRVVSYNSDLDMVTVSFVLDPNTYDEAGGPGVVAIFYSLDHGQTWDGPVVTSDLTGEGLENYYLSGIAYNPVGNTDPMNAYGVYQGIASPDLNLYWNNKAFGVSTLGGDNYFTEYFTNDEPGFEHDGYFNQLSLTQKDEVIKCLNIIAEGEWAAFTNLSMENIEGTYNGSGIDWEIEQSVIEMPFDIDLDGEAMWVGKLVFSDVGAEVVWSDDGQIGYAWMTGITTEAETGWQPILYKTTDGGDSWDFVEIDFQTDEAQAALIADEETGEGYIFSARDINEEPVGYCIPWFSATVGAVDADGNLQLFGDMNGHYYEFDEWFTADTYEYSRFSYAGHLFKYTIGEDAEGNDGLLDIMWVDSLRSNPVVDVPAGGDANLYCGSSGWLRRLQLSKNENSTEFFLTWTDTEDGDGLVDNLTPDVVGWSFNSQTGEHSERECKTCGTLYEGFYWFVQTSEQAMYDMATDTYTVPMINAVSVTEFSSNTSGAGDPVSVSYITGIDFTKLPVGVSEISNSVSGIEVSQNQPNPFTGTTTIEICSNTVAPVSIEVSNIMGQIVYTQNAGTLNGNMKVELNAQDLESGVYFYTVRVGSESISKKMIVE